MLPISLGSRDRRLRGGRFSQLIGAAANRKNFQPGAEAVVRFPALGEGRHA
jgi:hypothetical protein